MDPANQDEAVQQWMSFTSGSASQARQYLEANQWDVEAAVDSFFGDAGEEEDEQDVATSQPSQPSAPVSSTPGLVAGGGRTLGGGPAPASTPAPSSQPSTSRSQQPPRRGGIRTLGDLGGSSSSGHGHDHDDDDSDQEGHGQDMFAGGEKSGLAVQNPGQQRDIVDRIMKKAARGGARPGGEEENQPGQQSRFTGRGVTLGGDDAPSTVIEDPNADIPAPLPNVTRVLHIWRNGFSIDDGPLRDPRADPQNERILQMILQGHAPLSVLNVQPGQEVDLNVDDQRETDYVAPKKKYVPFSGGGQRLGETGDSAGASSATAASSATPAASSAPATSGGSASVNVDSTQPTVTLQIRLGDGTRLQSRFNTTHTVGEIYAFINAASPASLQRTWVLSTTFPPKELDDKSAVIGDLAELKRGGVVVQKWK